MPKRKRAVNSRQKRENDKKRKRQQRQKTAPGDVPADQTLTDSSVPCRTEEEAVSASPGNFPGLGFMGFPPKEEKPLARVQASPRVKMHSPAPRLPSPRGSLFVREQDKAPSPDSLERVCAPPRASGPDTVHVSGPAGQAQLETSMYGGTSRKIKDEGNLTVNKKETKRKSNRNENGNNEKHTFSDRYNDGKTEKTSADLWRQKSSKEDHTDLTQIPNEYEKRCRNRKRMQEIRQTPSGNAKKQCYAEKRRQSLRKRYKSDLQFREKKLKAASKRYLCDEEFQANVKNIRKQRYHADVEYSTKTKERSKIKYATDPEHRQKVKERIVVKYATDQDHKNALKQRSIEKYELNAEHRETVKARSKLKYKFDEAHRIQVNEASTKRYRENKTYRDAKLNAAAEKYESDVSFRSKRKASSKNQYDSSPAKKARIKERITNQKSVKRAKLENQDEIVKLFKEKAVQGIDYSCCCCDRLLFKNQVQKCEQHNYAKNEHAANVADLCIQDKYCHHCSKACPKNCVKSNLWICFTCHRKILSGNIPAEAAANKMTLEDIPKEFQELNSLEKHLIAIHIPFMKVMALPHGGQQNIHGPVVCVPSDLKKVTSLPMKTDEDLLLTVKLKRKLNYKGYIEYQFVNPKHIFEALEYLKQNNQWYQDVIIDTNWKPTVESCQITEHNEQLPNDEDQQQIATDTCLQPVDIAQDVLDHYFDDIYDIAPGEGNNPIRMLQEPGNEAKSFPYLFPTGKFSWNEKRETRITLSRYFNNRLMNTDDRFAKDSNYVFFSQFMSDLNQVIEKTQISIRKSVRRIEGERKMTANMVQNPEILSKMMKNDEALRFMQPIRGTPAYWSAAQKDLFAMLRQLGIPTWFCSFSAAEHRWSDAIATILRQQNDSRDPSKMDWAEKNEVLRSNPVTVARMFEHRFHVFQTEVIFSPSQPIGKVSDYFQRVEFQQRGSPHMHCLYWIENAPKLDENGEEEVCNFIDKYVSCAIPSDNEDLELKNIILSVQQHSKKHSKSCRKKGTECRFNFPRPPSTCTFINSPNEQDTLEDDADAIQLKVEHAKAKQILLQVWNEVQDEENGLENTEQIFEKLGLTQSQYIEAHRRLAKKTSVVLRRNPSELWTNQYNPCLLKCWDANMDIQFVLDPFSCIVYIISYISKSEREMGMVLKQTKIEAEEGNESARTTLKKIGSAYLNHREVSAQEAVYRVCNLKMKECSRKVVFVPVGENPTRLTKPLSQIKRKRTTKDDDEDEEDDEDIWMTNIVERYENRPNEPFFQNMCLAEFCSEFRVLSKSQVPKTHNENVYELQNSKGFIQKRTRTQPAIIRYPRFDAEKMSEKYYQSLLQLFLPYWGINQLKPPGFDQYDTFYENGYIRITAKQKLKSVKSIVDENKARYSQNEDVIAQAQENFENIGVPEDAWANLCPETELMRHELSAERNVDLDLNATEELPDMQSQKTNSDVLYKVQQNTQSKEEITIVLQNLNETQMKVFYMVREWCLKKSFGEKLEPMHIFITGGAGTGKSHLIKAIHYEASRLLGKQLTTPDSVSVLLTAFTGTAAFNIGGNTIHHLFSLPKHMPLPYEPLREQSLSEMRVQLADLHILVIDEISMVYKRLLYYIHERLVQIKKCKEPFGGVSVIAVGDFYQLPPVKQRKDERLYKENPLYPFDYWVDLFKEVELTEIMRQREDIPFAEALNTLRTREIKQSLEEQTNSILRECIREGPDDVLHVYATNDEVNAYNLTMLKKKCEEFVEINAQDFTKDKSTGKLNMRSKPFTRSKTDSLPSSLLLGLGAKVMLTRNCNVGDGLVNGVMGVVSKFVYGQRHAEKSVVAVEVLFHNMNVGKKTGKRSRNGNLVMIERIQEDMKDQKTNNVVRHQFPLRLSWACTAHKVQGLTVDKVVVNLDRSFSPGQGYVALSRVTSKEGLFIDSDKPELIQKKIYADPEVNSALQNMPKITFPNSQTSENDFNEDATSAGPIQTFMIDQGFKQIVDFKTTEGATILDHVYLSKSLKGKVEKLSTYYSYHDALILTIISST
nr:uncharacterized protein LOC105328139 [Crassostrea gigas]